MGKTPSDTHVKLKAFQDGGYTPHEYVAGVPFPNPQRDPMLIPYKIFCDAYYQLHAAASKGPISGRERSSLHVVPQGVCELRNAHAGAAGILLTGRYVRRVVGQAGLGSK
jgi:hypothetical protein